MWMIAFAPTSVQRPTLIRWFFASAPLLVPRSILVRQPFDGLPKAMLFFASTPLLVRRLPSVRQTFDGLLESILCFASALSLSLMTVAVSVSVVDDPNINMIGDDGVDNDVDDDCDTASTIR